MIRFFRNIRLRLLSDSRVAKYSLYAVGEIFLVVIGILIALQINNWNENQKQNKLELNLLSELKDNLTDDLQDIRSNIKEDQETLNSNEIILKVLEDKLQFHDSLSVHFGRLQRNSTLVANTSAYENLKSIGFSLISNDDLRAKITDLYSARYNYIEKIHNGTSSRIIWNYLNPQLIQNLESRIVLENAIPINFKELMNNNSLKEALRWHISIKQLVIDVNRNTEMEILEIIDLLNSEINTRS